MMVMLPGFGQVKTEGEPLLATLSKFTLLQTSTNLIKQNPIQQFLCAVGAPKRERCCLGRLGIYGECIDDLVSVDIRKATEIARAGKALDRPSHPDLLDFSGHRESDRSAKLTCGRCLFRLAERLRKRQRDVLLNTEIACQVGIFRWATSEF